VLALLVLFLLLPLYASEHIVYLMTAAAIFCIGVLGQNLLIGYTGLISFGQAGFLAIGAFTFGHITRMGMPWPLALLGGGLMSGIFGILVGFPSLRLKGPYLAIATMGFGVAVYQIFVNAPLLSGGRMGLAITKISPLFGLSQINFYFYFNVAFCLAFILLTYNIVSSYMGRAFIAIRDNDIAAEVLGVNLTRYKLLSFAVSSFYVGVQGGLLALFLGYLEPNMFTFMETIHFLVAVIVGGLASVEGAILGAIFVWFVPELFGGNMVGLIEKIPVEFLQTPLIWFFGSEVMVPTVFGLVIIIILIFERGGMAGRWIKMRLYFANWPFR
jgi:branched-chain amino acid transport system permease protein